MNKAQRIMSAFDRYLHPGGVYIETSPFFIMTFYDVIVSEFMAHGWRVDVILLQREFDRTLKSLVERGYYTMNPVR